MFHRDRPALAWIGSLHGALAYSARQTHLGLNSTNNRLNSYTSSDRPSFPLAYRFYQKFQRFTALTPSRKASELHAHLTVAGKHLRLVEELPRWPNFKDLSDLPNTPPAQEWKSAFSLDETLTSI